MRSIEFWYTSLCEGLYRFGKKENLSSWLIGRFTGLYKLEKKLINLIYTWVERRSWYILCVLSKEMPQWGNWCDSTYTSKSGWGEAILLKSLSRLSSARQKIQKTEIKAVLVKWKHNAEPNLTLPWKWRTRRKYIIIFSRRRDSQEYFN